MAVIPVTQKLGVTLILKENVTTLQAREMERWLGSKSTGCSSREFELDSQDPHGSLQLYISRGIPCFLLSSANTKHTWCRDPRMQVKPPICVCITRKTIPNLYTRWWQNACRDAQGPEFNPQSLQRTESLKRLDVDTFYKMPVNPTHKCPKG